MEKYLKPNLVIEPLVDNWYAWSHLVSPVTCGLNIVGRHMKIMQSFIKNPAIHIAATQNPRMKGGPFLDMRMDQVKDVAQLMEQTQERSKDWIELTEAISELNEILAGHELGYSLESLYDKIPAALKGYVELVYDLHNQTSFRFFETLLYQSNLRTDRLQQVMLWVTDNDERSFVLSTPRLEDENSVCLQLPFSDPRIDLLSKMKHTPGDPSQLIDSFDLTPSQRELMHSFFTTEPPVSYQNYEGDKVRMRYFGHACILVETADVSILLDPVISYYGYQQDIDRFSDLDLPDTIDYVLITHNHQDHILFETLLPLRHKIKHLIVPSSTSGATQDPNLKLMFQSIGFDQVIEIGEFDTLIKEDIQIMGIPFIGEHCDLNIQSKLCYHVKSGDFTMLFAADSCNIEPELYRKVQRIIGNTDVMFLGMECEGAPLSWLYGPLLPDAIEREQDESRRLAGSNFEQAKNLVETFQPLEVYVYAMGQEPWLEFISSIKYTPESHPIVQSDQLLEYCEEKEIVAERLFGEKEILYSKFSVLAD